MKAGYYSLDLALASRSEKTFGNVKVFVTGMFAVNVKPYNKK